MIDCYRSAMGAPVMRLLGAVLLAGSVAGCQLAGSVQPLEGILVIVATPEACGEPNGDLGPMDNCGRLTIIETGGLVRTGVTTQTNLGTVPADVLDALKAEMAATDFEALREAPWEGECPEGDDGWRRVMYEFYGAGGHQVLVACGTEIDRSHPLFVAVSDALRAVGQQLR
jgi:hypothetical protein